MPKKVVLMGFDYQDYSDDYKVHYNRLISGKRNYNLTMHLNSAHYYVGFRLCKK